VRLCFFIFYYANTSFMYKKKKKELKKNKIMFKKNYTKVTKIERNQRALIERNS